MKRYSNLIGKICDIENIKLAHINARKGKAFYKEVQMVNADIEKYCQIISDTLSSGKFVNSEYIIFKKIDKGKEREIYKLPYFPDRIIHHAIMQVLEPIWKPVLIKDTYQSIKGRGIHKAQDRIQPSIRSGLKYCLKMDVRKFYPSIDNDILKQIISRKIKCKETLKLLYTIIDSTNGVPIGNYMSQYFGNLYLTYFDHWMKEEMKAKHYYRYCDDIVILDDSKEHLHFILGEIKQYLQSKLKLQLKSNYQIFPVDRGVDFLGFRFFQTYTLLRKHIARNFRRVNVKDATKSQISSYYGWIKVSDSYNLLNKTRKDKHESRI